MNRTAQISRHTQETAIDLYLDLDGRGHAEVNTGVGFFDHMLNHVAKHALFDLKVSCQGDLHIDAHHSVEDVGICLGEALKVALGNKQGISRYGSATVPMEDSLAVAAVDLSGRPYLSWNAQVPMETLGQFSSQLGQEFWRAVTASALLNLHVILMSGVNTHHILEAIFKATARALRQAVSLDSRLENQIPSTKGILS